MIPTRMRNAITSPPTTLMMAMNRIQHQAGDHQFVPDLERNPRQCVDSQVSSLPIIPTAAALPPDVADRRLDGPIRIACDTIASRPARARRRNPSRRKIRNFREWN